MTSLDTESHTKGDDLSSNFNPISDAPDFFTDLSSTSPSIISNISFTVQSSINGYTIQCGDLGGNSENCTINIEGEYLIECDLIYYVLIVNINLNGLSQCYKYNITVMHILRCSTYTAIL